MLDIRPALAADLSAVQACVNHAFSVYIPRIGHEPMPMQTDYAPLIEQGRVSVLMDGELHGVLVMMPQGASMYIDVIAIEPRFQGQGLGRLLMAFAESQARALHLKELTLFTHEKMTENLRFYGLLGFVEVKREEVGGFHRVFLAKQLA